MKKLSAYLLGILCCFLQIQSNAQSTFPINDVASPSIGCYAFTNATIVANAQQAPFVGSLVIRKGIIENVGANISLPKDALIIDCKGQYIYPSFIDANSNYGVAATAAGRGGFNFQAQFESDKPGAYGWNQAIKSEINAGSIYKTDAAAAKELRASGFGTVLTHATDGISRGTGALVTLSASNENLDILKEKASAHYSFNKGSSTQDYPNSLMGCVALLRQNFLDAQWYKTKPTTEGTNLSLDAFNNNNNLPQFFDASDKWDILRADKVGDEFGVQYIIKGNGDEYQRIADIKATNASLIVPINFPTAIDVEDPTVNRFINVNTMQHWEWAPANLGLLEKNGVNFAITAASLQDKSSFLTNLIKAIKYGLSEQKALDALTKTPATLLGVYQQVGSLEKGKLANFLICSGMVFNEKTKLLQNWVQGKKFEINKPTSNEWAGNYKIMLGTEAYTLQVNYDKESESYKTKLLGKDTINVTTKLSENLVKLQWAFKKDSSAVTNLTGVVAKEGWYGNGTLANGKWIDWKATKIIESKDSSRTKDSTAKKDIAKTLNAPIPYPFIGYGNTKKPEAKNVLIKNATIWTGEKEGKLLNTDLLLVNGKINKIGKNLADANATIIDGTNKHITAGIIDEHSHIAIKGGVNECSQSVTAEVRVGDVLDPEDVDIYRQLAGGVTSSHLLHGSCNTIGGQTQLIKLRWGANAEQLKFANWDPFIKFALGENVKRSYNSQGNNRYPDSRMGVEALLTDAFTRALEYQKLGNNKRKDLELETLLEIINKKRFITCHSYVQSEILGMMKVAEKFGFTLNTFTHILEGFKVAKEMKQHGAAASTFSDWWAYKMEVQDAIPQNAYLMQQSGITVAINSDDAEMARRLNQEAAKSVKYANMNEEEALKMVTLNPAIALHVADRVGSIKIGKDADIVIWNNHPLSVYAKPEQTLVDGIIYFDLKTDMEKRVSIATEKNRLIQKMIAAKKGGAPTVVAIPEIRNHNQCEDDHASGASYLPRNYNTIQQ
jgi:imidazolonepropionase-like amidohydrolase